MDKESKADGTTDNVSLNVGLRKRNVQCIVLWISMIFTFTSVEPNS
jgi:hypothetical protein